MAVQSTSRRRRSSGNSRAPPGRGRLGAAGRHADEPCRRTGLLRAKVPAIDGELPGIKMDPRRRDYRGIHVRRPPRGAVMLDRRQFLGVMLMSRVVLAQGGGAIALPPPQTTGTVSLLQALRAR